jgi:hypothetical protein
VEDVKKHPEDVKRHPEDVKRHPDDEEEHAMIKKEYLNACIPSTAGTYYISNIPSTRMNFNGLYRGNW